MTTFDDAMRQMREAGMPPFPAGHPKPNSGRIVRYGPGKKAWYRLYEYESAKTGTRYLSGWFGLFQGPDDVIGPRKIESNWQGVDAPERERWQRDQAAAEAREEETRAKRARAAAMRAQMQWDAASRAGPWPYLERKQVTPEGVRCFDDGTLLVPICNNVLGTHPVIVGLQKISADGAKRFTAGMEKPGAAYLLRNPGSLVGKVLVITEGYATARSIRMAQPDVPVLVAFDAGNLFPAARALRTILPDVKFLFACDDDFQTAGNPGLTKAHAAADAVGARDGLAFVVRPLFKTARTEKWTDFNDLHCAEGLDAVREQLESAVLLAMSTEAGEPALDAPAETLPTPTAAAAAKKKTADDASPERGEWMRQLARTDKGAIKGSPLNIASVLANDPMWSGVIAKNEFSEAVEKLRPPPFPDGAVGEWNDIDDIRTRTWLEQTYGFVCRRDDLVDQILDIADRNRFHPLRDWLAGLQWDGETRLDWWARDYLGAPASDYTRIAARKFLIAMAARVFRPGCKADNVLILEGRQGSMKSTALRTLAGQWFTDTPLKIGDKEAYVLMQGMWIVELAELDSFSKADTSAAKLFFSQRENHYRPWYAKRPVKILRQCVFTGSVNNAEYLKDDTGNRRYWPIACGVIDIPGLLAVREQLFAEAVAAYHAGERWWVGEEARELFDEEQAARYVSDAYTDVIRNWLASESGILKDELTMTEIMGAALKLDTGKWTRPEQIRVGHCMRELKYVRRRTKKVNGDGARPWVYVKASDAQQAAVDDHQIGAKSAASDEQDVPI